MIPKRPAPAGRRLARALCLALAAAFSPAALAYDLLQAWQDARVHDATLASARAALAATGERVPQARAGLLPQLSGSAGLNRTHSEIQPSAGPLFTRNFTAENFGFSLTQPVLRLQNLETYEQSLLAVEQARAAYAAAELDLMLRVSQAYFDVLAAQDALTTLRAQKRAIAEQYESAKRSFEVGTATIIDQQEAQARFDLTTAQEAGAENSLAVARSALQLLVGRPVEDLWALARSVALASPQPAGDADWVAAARQANFAVQQFQLAAEIARREIRKARFAQYPTLDVVAQAGRSLSSTAQLVGTRTTSTSIGVQLALPLYAGGALTARTRETVALLGRADADLEATRRQAEQAARTAYLGVASGLAQVRALEAGERSSQLALDSNLLGYQVGVRINIDVLNAQQQLFTTRRDLARARYDTLLNGLRLKQATGSLSEADLATVNALLGVAPPEPELPLVPSGPVPLQGSAARPGAAAGSSTGVGATGATGEAGLPSAPPRPGSTADRAPSGARSARGARPAGASAARGSDAAPIGNVLPPADRPLLPPRPSGAPLLLPGPPAGGPQAPAR